MGRDARPDLDRVLRLRVAGRFELTNGEIAEVAPKEPWSETELLAPRRSLAGLVGVFVASRGIGLVREVGIAYYFGTSVAADRWAAAFAVVGVASMFLGEAAYASSVRWLGEQPAESSDAAFRSLLRTGARVAAAAALAIALLGPAATVLVLGSFENWGQAALLAVLLAPAVGANLLASCINARLTLQRRLVFMNATQILYSLGAVAGLLVIALSGAEPEAAYVAAGWSVGNLGALAVLYARTRPSRESQTDKPLSLGTLGGIGIPIGIAYSLTAVQELTDRTVAGRLETGDIAALGYANRLVLLPIGFVIAALGPMVLGTLTHRRSRADIGELGATAINQLRLMMWVLAPAAVLFAGVAPLLVEVVFQYGAFGETSTIQTTDALDGFAVGIAAIAISLLLFRAMQAVAPVRTLVVVGLAAVCLNAAVSVPLGLLVGIYGVTLATSVVALATVSAQIIVLARTLGVDWRTQALLHVGVPVLAVCAGCFALVTADRATPLASSVRLMIGCAAATLLAAIATKAARAASSARSPQ